MGAEQKQGLQILLMSPVCGKIRRKVPPNIFLALEQGPAKYRPQAESGPPLVFINEVILAHGRPCPFLHALSVAELEGLHEDCLGRKAENSSCRALCGPFAKPRPRGRTAGRVRVRWVAEGLDSPGACFLGPVWYEILAQVGEKAVIIQVLGVRL